MITIIYLVDSYGMAFMNRAEAVAYLRKNEYDEKNIAYLKRAFNLNLSEKDIVELINEKIRKVELR